MAQRKSARLIAYGTAFTFAASGVAACSPGSDSAGGKQSVTIALSSEPDALDPTTSATVTGREVMINMCEGLYDIDSTAKVVPALAADLPEYSPDGKTLTITLRKGVKFNDGTPFNAAGVVKTLERDKNLPTSARAGDLAAVTTVTAVDDLTVKLELSRPDAGLVGQLADRAGKIMSPAQLDKLGDDFGSNPMCVGPFTFVSRNPGSNIVLKKSEHYYDAAKVNLDELTFSIVADDNIRSTQLRAGAVQVSERIPTNSVSGLKSDPGVKIVQATSLGFWGVAINVGNSQGFGKPFSKVDRPLATSNVVREAFELSLDRDSINKVVYNDLFVPDCAPLSPVSPYATERQCPKRDVEKAKQLLASAGVKTPVRITLNSDNNTQTQALDQIIQAQAKEAGFEVKIQASDVTSLIATEKAGTYDAFILQWSGRVDPDANIRGFNATDGKLNYTGASTPEVDAKLSEATSLTTLEERKPLYEELTNLLLDRKNIVYLFHDKYFFGISSQLEGFQTDNYGMPRFKTASFSG